MLLGLLSVVQVPRGAEGSEDSRLSALPCSGGPWHPSQGAVGPVAGGWRVLEKLVEWSPEPLRLRARPLDHH